MSLFKQQVGQKRLSINGIKGISGLPVTVTRIFCFTDSKYLRVTLNIHFHFKIGDSSLLEFGILCKQILILGLKMYYHLDFKNHFLAPQYVSIIIRHASL